MRRVRWATPTRRLPAHPYRDSAILYAVLAGVFVGVMALTGGDVPLSVGIGCALFVATTAYSWWRWRQRIRQEEKE